LGDREARLDPRAPHLGTQQGHNVLWDKP
jgi:hypothetical protein